MASRPGRPSSTTSWRSTFSVCPVPQCITLRSLKPGEVDARTGKVVTGQYANWTTHPNNPMAAGATHAA